MSPIVYLWEMEKSIHKQGPAPTNIRELGQLFRWQGTFLSRSSGNFWNRYQVVTRLEGILYEIIFLDYLDTLIDRCLEKSKSGITKYLNYLKRMKKKSLSEINLTKQTKPKVIYT